MLQPYGKVTVLPIDESKRCGPYGGLKSCPISLKGVIKLVRPVPSGFVYGFLEDDLKFLVRYFNLTTSLGVIR